MMTQKFRFHKNSLHLAADNETAYFNKRARTNLALMNNDMAIIRGMSTLQNFTEPDTTEQTIRSLKLVSLLNLILTTKIQNAGETEHYVTLRYA